ncbi:hypothetical protein ACTXT7_007701 [Hymenolepis weldensis]
MDPGENSSPSYTQLSAILVLVQTIDEWKLDFPSVKNIVNPIPYHGLRPEKLHEVKLPGIAGESVHHCLIISKEVDGSPRFGFSEKALAFGSLEDLVEYYRVNSLIQHSSMLNTTLMYPAFLPSSTQTPPPPSSRAFPPQNPSYQKIPAKSTR